MTEKDLRNRPCSCPVCGESFVKIGSHWNHSSHGYPEIPDNWMEILVGVLMGDGNVDASAGNPKIELEMISWPFISYIYSELGWLSASAGLRRTALESAEQSSERQSGTRSEVAVDSYSNTYRFRTRRHPQLHELWSWYESGEKAYPEELELSPTILKMWYVSDGGLKFRYDSGKFEAAYISCKKESDRSKELMSLFDSIGLCVSIHEDHKIYISNSQCDKFFDYMGSPPPGFGYKWNRTSHSQYREGAPQARVL